MQRLPKENIRIELTQLICPPNTGHPVLGGHIMVLAAFGIEKRVRRLKRFASKTLAQVEFSSTEQVK